MTARDRVSFSLFVLLWLAPFLHRGLTNRPPRWMPHFLRYLHNASCLFTESVKRWRVDYMQVRFDARGEWVTLPEEDYFKMQPFGYDRTRLHRFMDFSLGDTGQIRRAELAAWIRQRYTELHPGSPQPLAVRFIVGQEPLRQEAPAGRWHKPPLESFPANAVVELSTHEFSDQAMRP